MGAAVFLGNLVPLATVVGQGLDLGHQVGQVECFFKLSLSGASEKNSLKALLGTTLTMARPAKAHICQSCHVCLWKNALDLTSLFQIS